MKILITFSYLIFCFCIHAGAQSKLEIEYLLSQSNEANVIGLGESNHGSASIQDCRFQFLNAIIDSLNYYHVFIEMPYGDWKLYELLREGNDFDSCEVFSYYFMKTDEWFSFCDSLYELQVRNPKLQIYGIDVQSSNQIFDYLNLLISRSDLAYSHLLQQTQNLQKEASDTNCSFQSTLRHFNELEALYKADFELFDELNLQSTFIAIRYSLIFDLLSKIYTSTVELNDYRDQMFYQLISEFSNDFETKSIILAHNDHLTKKSRTFNRLGELLDKKLHEQYYSCAIDFNSGQILVKSFINNEYQSPRRFNVLRTNQGPFLVGFQKEEHFLIWSRKLSIWNIGAVFYPQSDEMNHTSIRLGVDFDELYVISKSVSYSSFCAD